MEHRGVAYQITNDYKQFEKVDGWKLNYSERHFEKITQLIPSSLLFEETIETYEITKELFHKEACFCLNGITDPLASIFFTLTRMEEYVSEEKDSLGRFKGKNSLMFQFDWHEKAMCDRWSIDFLLFLKDRCDLKWHPKLELVESIATFDIDNAFAYLHKNALRTQLATAKDYLFNRKERISDRNKVLAGEMKDPYDTFDFIQTLAMSGANVLIFWLLGDYGTYDKNIPHSQEDQRELIRNMSEYAEIGVHASFGSNDSEYQLGTEIQRLNQITSKPVTKNRQHFLALNLPYTYQALIRQNITDDYSMGYADIAGFRAGTARVFNWFDLTTNDTTSLRVHPFTYMDGTLHEYLKLSPAEAMKKIKTLYQEVCQNGGQFSYIWHNETIGDYAHWKGWKEVFSYTINLNQTDFI
ncbi:MAG: polysaccharide deacetylase family protein [Flavobacteriia bacterium]